MGDIASKAAMGPVGFLPGVMSKMGPIGKIGAAPLKTWHSLTSPTELWKRPKALASGDPIGKTISTHKSLIGGWED